MLVVSAAMLLSGCLHVADKPDRWLAHVRASNSASNASPDTENTRAGDHGEEHPGEATRSKASATSPCGGTDSAISERSPQNSDSNSILS